MEYWAEILLNSKSLRLVLPNLRRGPKDRLSGYLPVLLTVMFLVRKRYYLLQASIYRNVWLPINVYELYLHQIIYLRQQIISGKNLTSVTLSLCFLHTTYYLLLTTYHLLAILSVPIPTCRDRDVSKPPSWTHFPLPVVLALPLAAGYHS